MKTIFIADDFGRSSSINAAILRAHREGVLAGASLMVAGQAVEEAVSLARATPTLAVGLHLVAINGPACLPPSEIPHLVDDRGFFPATSVETGLRYFFSRTAQKELEREVEAQFERFASTRLPLAHVNGHLHMHMHPTVFNLVLPLALQYGASGIRIPRDDLRAALTFDKSHWAAKITQAMIFALLARWALGRLRNTPLAVTDRVYGLMQTGNMQEDYVLGLLRRNGPASAELYFHPTTMQQAEPLGPNPGDLAALLSPALRQLLAQRSIRVISYPVLESELREGRLETRAGPSSSVISENPSGSPAAKE